MDHGREKIKEEEGWNNKLQGYRHWYRSLGWVPGTDLAAL